MDVLPPLVVTGADRATPADHAAHTAALDERLRTLPTAPPIPYRTENGGDYDDDLVLRPHLAPRPHRPAHPPPPHPRTAPHTSTGAA
ncbi:hypothetical protein [Actinomadura madurae]|uniref:hypothetical protein n=1 Tax=Actinomadura madurae TaxID=1993 RepID=UPI0020D24622|nr:hypothetical protein [Actinomadura madurae]MCQ0012987.1 hypothetical protein [Actinomadura madurae]